MRKDIRKAIQKIEEGRVLLERANNDTTPGKIKMKLAVAVEQVDGVLINLNNIRETFNV